MSTFNQSRNSRDQRQEDQINAASRDTREIQEEIGNKLSTLQKAALQEGVDGVVRDIKSIERPGVTAQFVVAKAEERIGPELDRARAKLRVPLHQDDTHKIRDQVRSAIMAVAREIEERREETRMEAIGATQQLVRQSEQRQGLLVQEAARSEPLKASLVKPSKALVA